YKAHYGDGVYAWESNATGVGKYIDIEVPPGTAIEKLVVQGSGGQQVYYRIVGAESDSVAVKVIGTNFTEAELAKFRFILED
ncbi:MAG: hypothetical protein KDB01_21200, partial [Planctomycetaceae bacterium]|nr:hypothetical protein [Planctomycetaceae bacterium]